MHNRLSNPSKHEGTVSRVGRGACTAFLATAAVTASGILASRLISRKAGCPCAQRPLPEGNPEKVHADLLRVISHDLRTPLSGIMGSSLLYLENQGALNDEEKLQLVEHIHEDADWLTNIVENLLAITRIKDMENSLSTREEIVEEVLGEVLHKMEARHPDFVIRASIPDEIIMLPMDALLIEQAIINLLENALLHSGSAEPVDVIVEDGKDFVTFTVRDYGQGIPDKVLDGVLSGTSNPESASSHWKTGIGLVICRIIISAHHGSFTGRNHGHGAEFIFTLPKRSG